MKRPRDVLFALLVPATVSISLAQNSLRFPDSAPDADLYLSPKNDDIYVPTRTTIIVRIAEWVMSGRSASDFQFDVRGNSTGTHPGHIVISDDNRTLIFKPSEAFRLNEEVSVVMRVLKAENSPPLIYHFRTTAMSDEERTQALLVLQEQEHAEQELALRNDSSQDSALHCPLLDSLPIDFSIDLLNNPAPGNVYFSAANLFNSSFSFIGILDNSGKPAFYRNIPLGCENFKVLPDSTLSYFKQTSFSKGGLITGKIERMDINGKIIEDYLCGNGYTTDYHDFQLLPNDHTLLVSFDPEYVDMTKVTGDTAAKSNAKVTGAIIQEIDKEKNVVFQWRSWDHLAITDATHEKLTASSVDYVHLNTAFIDTDGNIIASLRHQDAVIKISRADGSTIWRWGGKDNQFKFIGDTLQFSHQHNPARIANGHITLLDNGNYRLKDTMIDGTDTVVNRPFTRAVEFDLDEIHHTATAVWEYRNVAFCQAGGNVQRLPDGNTFIGLGINTSPAAIEINPSGQKVFQLSLQPFAWCYRAYKFPLMVNALTNSVKSNAVIINLIYPNPASRRATITFTALEAGLAEMNVLNVLGRSVRYQSQKTSGQDVYSFDLDVQNLPNGPYYCKLSQNGNTTIKMLVVQK